MRAKCSSRLAFLSLVALFAACSTSTGGRPDANAPAGNAGTGAAGTTGAAGGGPAGTSGASGVAGQSTAGTGAAGAAGSGGGAGTGAAGQDAAAPDGPSDGSAESTAPVDAKGAYPPLPAMVKIMVLGSSNEEGTCWRAFLWKKLRDAGITNFDFVGRNHAGPECTGVTGYDKDSEAHGGTVVENISADAWLTTFKANPPDIILQHNGGADLLNGLPYMNVIKAYTLSVTQVRMVSPHVIYLAAQHTPQGSANDVKNVMVLNDAMVPWAAGLTTGDSPVEIVDLFTGIDQKTDMSDGTHLNEVGSEKVAQRWFAKLMPILKP